jgi:hypothetical protein
LGLKKERIKRGEKSKEKISFRAILMFFVLLACMARNPSVSSLIAGKNQR